MEIMKRVWEDTLDYNHNLIKTTPKDMIKRLQAGEQVLAFGMLKTAQREKIMTFTELPCRLASATMVALRAEDAPLLAPAGVVSIRTLLEHKKLTLIDIPGLTYGKLQPIIDKHKKISRTIVADNGAPQLVSLLIEKKGDWAIVDPLVITYFNKEAGFCRKVKLARIKENPTGFLPGYIAGPKTEWGKTTLRAIDAAIRTLIQTNALYKQLKPSVPKELMQDFNEEYRKRIHNPALEPIPIQ